MIDILALAPGDIVFMRVAIPSQSRTPVHRLRFQRYEHHNWNVVARDAKGWPIYGDDPTPETRDYALFVDETHHSSVTMATPEARHNWNPAYHAPLLRDRYFLTEAEALASIQDEARQACDRAARQVARAQERLARLTEANS